MPTIKANGLDIFYDTFGKRGDAPLLLVMGLGAQMTQWDEGFCQKLADRGFFVVRYDNRDAGLSSKIEAGGTPDIGKVMAGDRSNVPYLLDDMADDAAGVIDALGMAPANIVGASMGGMIVQALAIRHPAKVRSLCSIMSTTGDPSVGQPTPEAMAALLAPPPTNRAEAIEGGLRATKVIGGTFPIDEGKLRARIGSDYDRSNYPVGMARQLVAIIASPDRTEGLKGVHVPTLVIHGEADSLVTPSGGAATAAAVPGATLMKVPGMGHDMPEQVVPQVVDAIAKNAS
ncbi:MAG: alpha/beta fold hydrolase [Tepidiformaceae bacterium]